jgi:hypothetical protein
MNEFMDLVKQNGGQTVVLFQCPFRAGTSKSTRLMSTMQLDDPLLPSVDFKLARGWPVFDKNGFYKGPLPAKCGHYHRPLIGRKGAVFVTSAAAAYPALMCEWLAFQMVGHCMRQPLLKVGGSESLPSVEVPELGGSEGPVLEGLEGLGVAESSVGEEPGVKALRSRPGGLERRSLCTTVLVCAPLGGGSRKIISQDLQVS